MSDDEGHDAAVLSSHLRKLLAKRLECLTECHRFELTDDPTRALHDLRVASRRLRAFGDVLSDEVGAKSHARIDKALKRVTRAAREVRDWDVQMALASERRARAATDLERATLEHLLEIFDRARSVAARRVQKRLARVDFDALCDAIRRTLGDAILRLPRAGARPAALASGLLSRLVGDVAAAMPPKDGAERPDEMHRCRIALKRLRYTLEMFEPLMGASYGPLCERATALQELLGDHHDLVVFEALTRKAASELATRGRDALSSGMTALLASASADRDVLLARSRTEAFDAEWWLASIRERLDEA